MTTPANVQSMVLLPFVRCQTIHITLFWNCNVIFIKIDKLFAIPFFSLQMILKEVDSVLYVDTDVLFLQPVELIWDMLTHFNSTQLVAMAPEHEEPRIAWYSRFSRHPYYGKTGINSGAMLMNLTRMRMTQFKVRLKGQTLKFLPLCESWCTWTERFVLNLDLAILFQRQSCGLQMSCDIIYYAKTPTIKQRKKKAANYQQ